MSEDDLLLKLKGRKENRLGDTLRASEEILTEMSVFKPGFEDLGGTEVTDDVPSAEGIDSEATLSMGRV